MKKLKTFTYSILLLALLITPLFTSNFSNANSDTQKSVMVYHDKYRVGCGCCDGTSSSATGRGACSWHGGVQYWIYYNDKTGKYTYVSTGRCD